MMDKRQKYLRPNKGQKTAFTDDLKNTNPLNMQE